MKFIMQMWKLAWLSLFQKECLLPVVPGPEQTSAYAALSPLSPVYEAESISDSGLLLPTDSAAVQLLSRVWLFVTPRTAAC